MKKSCNQSLIQLYPVYGKIIHLLESNNIDFEEKFKKTIFYFILDFDVVFTYDLKLNLITMNNEDISYETLENNILK